MASFFAYFSAAILAFAAAFSAATLAFSAVILASFFFALAIAGS